MGEYNSLFDLDDEVFVVFPRCERKDKVCPECNGEPQPPGRRCIFCQGYGTVFDRNVVVFIMDGPARITSVNICRNKDGVSESYTVDKTWDQPHLPHNIFPTEEKARQSLESVGASV